MFKEYNDYIVSKEWYDLKVEIISKRGCKCERCNKIKNIAALQLHHLTYQRLFNEEPQDLMLLCKKCHESEHCIIRIKPKKKIRNRHWKKLSRKDRRLQDRYDKIKISG